ncbi:glutamate--cysteine ligase [Haloarchaeobius sp. DFWS5]|uniref:glutamate--cysteine ligase n=1 Tax=Haloarchaeobius sp. DFWS5 TaxID=3446114 RepID=UPI003EBB4500
MERGSADAFTDEGTLGIEEEFFVVDRSGRPISGSDELVYEGDPPDILEGRLDHELFKTVVETQTPKSKDLVSVRDNLYAVREALVEFAAEYDYQIAAAGLHPAAKWRELEHAEKERYRAQLDRIQYPQHRNTTAGLHVHVGVDDADKAVWVANELRWYLPVMLALSANSPYWNGFDTGLASARAKIFENLPNTGMPTRFEDFESYQRFENLMIDTDSINDRGALWYEVRPHSAHGTVEVRTPDAQADPEVVMAFAEYTAALVEDFSARYEDGETAGDDFGLRREVLDENKWRALRHGHDASFVTRAGDGTISLGEVVDRECDRLGISGISDVFDGESGADRQRRLLDEGGLDAVCDSLVL